MDHIDFDDQVLGVLAAFHQRYPDVPRIQANGIRWYGVGEYGDQWGLPSQQCEGRTIYPRIEEALHRLRARGLVESVCRPGSKDPSEGIWWRQITNDPSDPKAHSTSSET